MSLNFGTSFMSTERETESGKVFVGFVLPSTGISNPGMTYRDRAMGHCLWMDGWTEWMTGRTDGKLHAKRPRHPLLYVMCTTFTWFGKLSSTSQRALHSWQPPNSMGCPAPMALAYVDDIT
jgi:hypothetical protein